MPLIAKRIASASSVRRSVPRRPGGHAPTPSPAFRSCSGTARSPRSAARRRRTPGAASPRSTRRRSSMRQYGPMNDTPLIEPAHRGRVHDMRRSRLAAQDRQEARQSVDDAPQVHVEHPPPIIERLVLDQVERGHAGVVAQHIDPPEPVDRHLRQSVRPTPDRRRPPSTASASPPAPRQPIRDRLGFATVEVGEHDRRPGGDERLGEGAADAARRAGHYRDPPGADHRLPWLRRTLWLRHDPTLSSPEHPRGEITL